jgi:hypothetical protein
MSTTAAASVGFSGMEGEAEASPQPSFWSRVKARAVTLGATVVKTVRTITKRIRAITLKITIRATPTIYRAWTLAIGPFLRGVLAGAVFAGVVASALAAPVTTALVLAGVGLAAFLFSYGLEALDRSADESWVAFGVLRVLSVLFKAGRLVVYAAAAALAVKMTMVSWPFAVASAVMLVLAYRGYVFAGTVGFLIYCGITRHWLMAAAWLTWQVARTVTNGKQREALRREVVARQFNEDVADEIRHQTQTTEPSPDGQFHGVKGAQEVSHVQTVCGFCEENLSDVSIEQVLQIMHDARDQGVTVCDKCFVVFEARAIEATGTSLLKNRINLVLTAYGRTLMASPSHSTKAPTHFHWEAAAWWRDRQGKLHERQLDCFLAGEHVATVVYDHDRRVMRVSAYSKFVKTIALKAVGHGRPSSSFVNAMREAQEVAMDVVNDARGFETRPIKDVNFSADGSEP